MNVYKYRHINNIVCVCLCVSVFVCLCLCVYVAVVFFTVKTYTLSERNIFFRKEAQNQRLYQINCSTAQLTLVRVGGHCSLVPSACLVP